MHTSRVGGASRAAEPNETPSTEPFFDRAPAREPEVPHDAGEAARMFAENAAAKPKTASDAAGAPPENDRVLYLGLNTTKTGEVAQNDREHTNLVFLTRGQVERVAASSSSKVDGFDLSTKEGVLGFARSLRLDAAKADAVAAVLANAPTEGRDELAGIAKVLARAERGGVVPSRWVLSGHHGDTITDGASGNALRAADVRALAKALPAGAASVRDLMISGCYSGGREQLAAWKEAFPNLRSAWGYGWQGSYGAGDKSPSDAGAVRHIQEWEAETRGARTPTAGARSVAAVGGQNISLWVDGRYAPATSGQHQTEKP